MQHEGFTFFNLIEVAEIHGCFWCRSNKFFFPGLVQSRRLGGGALVGLAPPNKAPTPPKLKRDTL